LERKESKKKKYIFTPLSFFFHKYPHKRRRDLQMFIETEKNKGEPVDSRLQTVDVRIRFSWQFFF